MRWSAVKRSEVKCSAVKGVKSWCTVKGIYGWWSEVRWSAVKRSEVKCGAVKGVKSWCTVKGIYGWWSEVKWSAVKGVKSWCTVKGIYGWWSEVRWRSQGSEVKVLLQMVYYTCGLTTLETRYCSFSPLCCFSYVHFVLICTVVVLYCFEVCVCVCVHVCVCVCVCVGFVMCVFVRVL